MNGTNLRGFFFRTDPSSEPGGGASPGRVGWIDFARGVCVVLVVVHHVVRQFVQTDVAGVGAAGLWTWVDEFLTPVRIPLFFVISGMLASKDVFAGGAKSRRRTLTPAYLYLLWSILLGLRLLIPQARLDEPGSALTATVAGIFLATSGYWYLYALPVYFFFTRFTRSIRFVWLVIPLSVLLILHGELNTLFTAVSTNWTSQPSLLGSVVSNTVFFVVGARFREWLMFCARNLTFRGRCVSVIFGAVILLLSALVGSDAPILVFAAGFVGCAWGLVLASSVKVSGQVAAFFAYVGARTLPVYVLQFMFISILSALWSVVGKHVSGSASYSWLWIGYVPVVSLIMTFLSLVFYSLATRFGFLRWLFAPPSAFLSSRHG